MILPVYGLALISGSTTILSFCDALSFHAGPMMSMKSFVSNYNHGDSHDMMFCQRRRSSRDSCWVLNLSASSSSADADAGTDNADVSADDVESVHSLFLNHCDTEGLMTKDDVMSVPGIGLVLKDGDLLMSEMDDIWNSAPKFPCNDDIEKIDVDSFTQIYRDIDDLFEDGDEDGSDAVDKISSSTQTQTEPIASSGNGNSNKDSTSVTTVNQSSSSDNNSGERELEDVFKSLCDSSGLISRGVLIEWDEVQQLINDNLLGEDEFNSVFEKTMKSPGTSDMLDVDGFLSFNAFLDDLFELDDEEEEVVSAESSDSINNISMERPIVTKEDLPAGVLFAELVGTDDLLMSWDDLKRWGELRQMIAEGDLLPSELETIFASIPKSQNNPAKINEEGFCELYQAIFDLFEEDDEENTSSVEETSVKPNYISELYRIIDNLERQGGRGGIGCSENDDVRVLDVVKEIESSSDNIVKQQQIQNSDIAGSWSLLYTSSGMFKFNRGLTGLAGSVPNAEFGGLKQVIKYDDYISDIKYIEKISVIGSEESSFDAVVDGDWELKTSISLFTGEPTVIMSVEPDKVVYGPTTTRADHWKSVRSMNLLDISYLDKELRIMRGNTSIDTVFIFKRL